MLAYEFCDKLKRLFGGMKKEFDKWNTVKKAVNEKAGNVLFHDREIWWCSLGVNVGSEQDGINDNFERAVLIVRNFNGKVCWAVPLTRTFKLHSPYYFPIERGDDNEVSSAAIISQLRLISSKRLIRKIRTLEQSEFERLIYQLERMLRGI